MSELRVWQVGDPEPVEPSLLLIDADMAQALADGRDDWWRDPSWFRLPQGSWSGPYAYKLNWDNLLAEHGPMTEYKRSEEAGRE